MIPEQLKDCRFCKVGLKKFVTQDKDSLKRPFEKGWQNKHYSYEEASVWRQNNMDWVNYGVHLGLNNLAVLDDDTESKWIMDLFVKEFGESFRVRDHYYIKLKNWDCVEIGLVDYDNLDEKGNPKALGEVKGLNHMAVAPGSIHPSGKVYDLRKDIPIKEIDFEDFKRVFGKYFQKPKVQVVREFKKTRWEGESVTDIPITSIISLNGMTDKGGGIYQGSNPVHGSKTGNNFIVNTLQNTWYCFRSSCQSGGGPAELIAVVEGIIDCSQAGPSCFTKEEGQEVIKVAREKYGLKAPEQLELKPMGWALSINIKKFAERENFLNCPKCNVPFQFKEEVGWYKCSKCGDKGGLKKFAKLYLQQEKIK